MQQRSVWTAALVLAATMGSTSRLAAQQAPVSEPFLMVTGQAEARMASDRARIDFMVETQAKTAQQAAAQNADLMDRVVRALRAAGGPAAVVETGGYDLSPVYRQVPNDQSGIPVIEAYRTVNHVRVRADDVTKVGALIDGGIAAGANRVASLSFEAKDPEPARIEALKSAVAKARTEAEAVATAMGVTLGGPLEVQVNADYMQPYPNAMYREVAMDMAQSAPTPVSPGEQVVRANVTVRYKLVGGR